LFLSVFYISLSCEFGGNNPERPADTYKLMNSIRGSYFLSVFSVPAELLQQHYAGPLRKNGITRQPNKKKKKVGRRIAFSRAARTAHPPSRTTNTTGTRPPRTSTAPGGRAYPHAVMVPLGLRCHPFTGACGMNGEARVQVYLIQYCVEPTAHAAKM